MRRALDPLLAGLCVLAYWFLLQLLEPRPIYIPSGFVVETVVPMTDGVKE